MVCCIGWDLSDFMRVTTTCWPRWDGRDIWVPSGMGVWFQRVTTELVNILKTILYQTCKLKTSLGGFRFCNTYSEQFEHRTLKGLSSEMHDDKLYI